jgi:hypothetical protein
MKIIKYIKFWWNFNCNLLEEKNKNGYNIESIEPSTLFYIVLVLTLPFRVALFFYVLSCHTIVKEDKRKKMFKDAWRLENE